MDRDLFKEREQAAENAYFRSHDARLIERLRKEASLDEVATALRDKLQLDNPDLLLRVRETGLTPERAPALLFALLVKVAWADDTVTKLERDAVLRHARRFKADDEVCGQLSDWLNVRPSEEVFDVALEVIKFGLAVLTRPEQQERIGRLIDACTEVAAASGKGLAPLLGLGTTISRTEASMLDSLNRALRSSV